MRAIIILLTLSIYSLAINLPYKFYTTIASVNGNSVTLSEAMPYKGMSALVVRYTPNGEYALVFINQTSNSNRATIIDKDPVGGGHLAMLKPTPKVGDRVIGGLNYDKVLLLAPKSRYNQIISQLGVNSINPELYQAYIANSKSRGYRDFAKLTGIGLVIVAKGNTLEVIDAISEKTILKERVK